MSSSLVRNFRLVAAGSFAVSLAAIIAACSSSSSGGNTDSDGGIPGNDASTNPDKDSGGNIGTDSGTPGKDGGGTDSGTTGQDAGPPGPRYVGRISVNGTDVTCDWSGCRAMAKFHGTSASISIGGSLGSSNYDVIVDGVITKQIVVNPANAANPFVLAAGLPNADHTVEIYKRSEGQDGIETYHGFTFPEGGAYLPPPLPGKHLIEFVGDSITAGFGVEGTGGDPANCANQPLIDTLTNVHKSFAGVTAQNLGADGIFIAYSGKGVTRNFCQVQDMNQCTAGADGQLMFGNADPTQDLYGMFKVDDGAQTWGFKPLPDAVVIALGADDFNNPGNGTPPTQMAFQTAYQAMLLKVRAKNPNAYIFAMYSPGIQDLGGANDGLTITKAAIPAAVLATKDAKIFYVDNIPNAGMADGTGCLTHPNAAYQASAGTSLTGFIKGKTGW
jgi:hypothetical protein